jgi:uncharacterized hydrophobic protein (TIGR00271 family)
MSDNTGKERHVRADIQLFRALSAYPAAALGVEVSTAVGLFALLGLLIGLAGTSAPGAFLLATFGFFPTVLAYAELSARIPGPGGSYRLVAPTLPGLGAFLSGWASLLGQISAGAILALAGAAYLAAVLETLFPAFTFPPRLVAIPIVLLITLANFRGVRLSRRLQGYLVAGVAGLLLLLAVVSGWHRLPSASTAPTLVTTGSWLIGVGALLAGLWSVEVIVGVREEIHRPHHNAPRAILSATIVAGLLGAAVALSASRWAGTANLRSPTAVIAEWAGAIGGPWAWWIAAIVGVLFSSLALNRIAVTTLRQVHAQGQEGHLPLLLTRISPDQRTPAVAVSVLGAATLGLALWGDTIALAQLSGLCLLLTGSLVDLAAALGRRSSSKPGPFALPLHPFIPASGIVVNLALLFALSASSLIQGGGWMLIGVGLYFLYIRRLRIVVQEGTTVFHEEGRQAPTGRYRVLVPVNDPTEAMASVSLAATLAGQQEGEVVLLQVVQVPDQVNVEAGRRWAQRRLDALAQIADQVPDVTVRPVIRLARDVSRAIIGTANEENCQLIVMGWRGPTLAHRADLGAVLGPVLDAAPCNVIVVKGREMGAIQRVLVPTAGGPHAPLAARMGLALVQKTGGQVTLLNVVPGDRADEATIEAAQRLIAQTAADLGNLAAVTTQVDIAPDVASGILAAAEDHDLILLGTTEESILDQVLFGHLPEQVASRARKPVAIVKRYRGLPQTWARQAWQTVYNLFPTLDQGEQIELLARLRRGARANRDYYVLIFISAIIATLGLLQNSAAVIIGAMLVAPLMTPILSLSLGIVLGDVRTLRVAAESAIRGVLAAVGIALLLTRIAPAVEATAEIAARTQPTLLDLFVALASGAAGAYALGRKEVAAALPGVAIAAALMPPVCTIGIGLALGQPKVAGGAALLFLTNLVAIGVAGCLIFLLLGIRPKLHQRERRVLLQQGLTLSLILLVIVAIPLGLLLARSAQEMWRGWTLESTLRSELGGAEVVQLEHWMDADSLHVTATVYALEIPVREDIQAIQLRLQETLGKPVVLRLTVVPVAEFTVP